MEVVADGLDSPTAVAVDADGGVYVSEEFAGRVLRVGGASPGGAPSSARHSARPGRSSRRG